VSCIGSDDIIFHGLSPVEQDRWGSVLTHSALATFSGTATYEPWYTTATAFVICEEDHAIPPPVQEQMAQLLGTESVYRVKSSHSVFLSHTEKVTEILEHLIAGLALKG
jgi:hypothetical protein